MVRFVPEALLVRILPPGMRYDRTGTPVAVAPLAERRLLVTPMNYSGQGRLWAAAASANVDGVEAVNLAVRVHGGVHFPADVSVPVAAYAFSRSWYERQRAAALQFTHVLVEAERHPLGRIYATSVRDQVRGLIDGGVAVAMLCHGTDIRLPSRHAADEPDSPFRPGMWDKTPELERQARHNRALLDELRVPVYVSTPGLLDDVPYARWLPVVVDEESWQADDEPLRRAVPVVAHIPSSGIVKGSDLIDPVLRELEAEGTIVYSRVHGVPPAEMPAVYRSADVVLDQFRIGDYGVTACEAMAAGRVVVGHVSERVRTAVRQNTGLDLPIVEATAERIRHVVLDICEHRDEHRVMAARGPAFVRAVHDGRMAADVLRPFLTKGQPD
jgi:hypothetical protein